MGFQIDRVVTTFRVTFGFHQLALGQQRRYGVHAHIKFGVIFGLTGNNQRRTRLVDQDGIHFVNDGKTQTAHHAISRRIDHVVAQIIKTEFVVGAVSDIRGVGDLLIVVWHLRKIHPYGEAEKLMQAPHPFRVTLGEVIVDRNHMHRFAGNRVEIGRQRRHQRLAFTRTHFGNLAAVQDHAAYQLHIKVAHAERTQPRFAHHGEGLG